MRRECRTQKKENRDHSIQCNSPKAHYSPSNIDLFAYHERARCKTPHTKEHRWAFVKDVTHQGAHAALVHAPLPQVIRGSSCVEALHPTQGSPLIYHTRAYAPHGASLTRENGEYCPSISQCIYVTNLLSPTTRQDHQ